MTEAAGLALGVVALWKTCVEVFEVVDSGRSYGMEYELLRVKLEVERIRLVTWGDTIGLDGENSTTRPDTRLQQSNVNETVMRLLGCIQHIFDNSERLQSNYGLRPSEDQTQNASVDIGVGPGILGAVFRRPYENLRRAARDRQRDTKLRKKALWAIHDRRKFQTMIMEIKGFNDNLESLFPGSRLQVAEALRIDVESSAAVEELQLLQEATSEDHEVLSDVASARLEVLGASTVRSELLTDRSTVIEGLIEVEEDNWEDLDRVGNTEDSSAEAGDDAQTAVDPEMTALEKRLEQIELYCSAKQKGALSISIHDPQSYSSKVSAYVYYGGQGEDRWWSRNEDGYVEPIHACFELYKRKKFHAKRRERDYDLGTEDDSVLFSVESNSEYENVNPGTVTVKGFALDAWDYEDTNYPRESTVFTNASDPGSITAKQLLRRIDELQKGAGKLGWNREIDLMDMREFTGSMGITYYDPSYEFQLSSQLSNLYSMLNRSDIFVNFLGTSSICLEWNNPKKNGGGIWNLLWQVILAKELARRLESKTDGGWTSGFTPRVLASLIVSDLWLKNVEIVLGEPKFSLADLKGAENAAEKARAENFKKKGNEALAKNAYQKAFEFYTEALKIDLRDATYRCNRSAASYSLENFEDAMEDAYVATRIDPKYAKAWSRIGAASTKCGLTKRGIQAFERAIELAGNNVSAAMQTGLANAKAQQEDELKKIDDEKDLKKREELRKAYIEQDYNTLMKGVEMHSRCHEQQVEGLLLFAEKMKWPWINEVRNYAEEAYSDLRGGQTLPADLHDWLFGMTLPGQWFAFKIMTALILCTPSIKQKTGIAAFFDCGLSLTKKSYWRVRTVLGRVLGCLPGVISLCGWIGPCPPVEFLSPVPVDADKPHHIRLKARNLSLVKHISRDPSAPILISSSGRRYDDTQPKEGEEIEPWMADMRNANNWIVPEPPVKQVGTCELKAIQLKRNNAGTGSIDDEDKVMYLAQLVFKRDDSPDLQTYKLFTNPVFVTPPPCRAGPKGAHEIHLRELHKYSERNIWTIEQLREHTAEDTEDIDVMVINATGKGAELLARAWCSERGKNAVIRRAGGPCYVCAVQAASQAGLRTGVLIWVS
ncbi:prion-inhibition and propagation-domain-containing protein [Bipolaris maydis]|nr:prion-inhibition and propagation-domain-containing protein [Bipolaris maydis]